MESTKTTSFEVKEKKKKKLETPQKHLADPKNSKIIIDYLEEVVKLQNASLKKSMEEGKEVKEKERHIGHAFRVDTNQGRPFFPDLPITLTAVDKVIDDKNVINEYKKRFKKFESGDTKKIEDTIEYFFRPIEESDAWKEFWAKQVELIKRDPSIKDVDAELTKIRNQIASGLAYKIQGRMINADKPMMVSQKQKIMNTTLAINALGENREGAEEIKGLQLQKEAKDVENDVGRLETAIYGEISNGELEPQDIYEKVKKYLVDLRKKPHFRDLPNGEELLQEYLRGMFRRFKDYQLQQNNQMHKKFFDKKQECVEQLARGILADIYTNHSKEFKGKEAKGPLYLTATLEKVAPYIGEKGKSSHTKAFDMALLYYKHHPHRRMTRTFSEGPSTLSRKTGASLFQQTTTQEGKDKERRLTRSASASDVKKKLEPSNTKEEEPTPRRGSLEKKS